MVFQGICSHEGKFILARGGYRGNAHDSHIFKSSSLCHMMYDGTFVPGDPHITFSGVRIPPILLADHPWLMKTYTVPSNAECKYKGFLNRSRNVVECAIGHPKARFHHLSSRLEVYQENLNSAIASCVVLHNRCKDRCHSIPECPVESNQDTCLGNEAESSWCNAKKVQRERVMML